MPFVGISGFRCASFELDNLAHGARPLASRVRQTRLAPRSLYPPSDDMVRSWLLSPVTAATLAQRGTNCDRAKGLVAGLEVVGSPPRSHPRPSCRSISDAMPPAALPSKHAAPTPRNPAARRVGRARPVKISTVTDRFHRLRPRKFQPIRKEPYLAFLLAGARWAPLQGNRQEMVMVSAISAVRHNFNQPIRKPSSKPDRGTTPSIAPLVAVRLV